MALSALLHFESSNIKMVEVFSTNVQRKLQARRMVALLQERFPGLKANLDMHDCDRVLRVEGAAIEPEQIIAFVADMGFACAVLD